MQDLEEWCAYLLPLPGEITRGRAKDAAQGADLGEEASGVPQAAPLVRILLVAQPAFYHTPGQGLPTRNAGLAPLRGVYFCTRPVLTSAV